MRQLASIKQITNIRPIAGRDFIVQCMVDGWNVIIRKDKFNEGDLCVYVEIDSKLPETETFKDLEAKKYIIKTMKMAGVLSEGIAFGLDILPPGKYVFNQDVTQILGITQYNKEVDPDPSVPAKSNIFTRYLARFKWYRKWFMQARRAKNAFPGWITKTDETRIQNIPDILSDTKKMWVATEKVDGSSATFGLRRRLTGDEYVICSRNCNVTKEPSNIWKRVSESYQMEHILSVLADQMKVQHSIVIQGEIIGPGIQGNKYKVDDLRFYLFNLVVDGRRIGFNRGYFQKWAGIDCVPLVYIGRLKQLNLTEELPLAVKDILQLATFESKINDTVLAEGLVFRLYDDHNQVVRSFKAVSPDFLIANKE